MRLFSVILMGAALLSACGERADPRDLARAEAWRHIQTEQFAANAEGCIGEGAIAGPEALSEYAFDLDEGRRYVISKYGAAVGERVYIAQVEFQYDDFPERRVSHGFAVDACCHLSDRSQSSNAIICSGVQ